MNGGEQFLPLKQYAPDLDDGAKPAKPQQHSLFN